MNMKLERVEETIGKEESLKDGRFETLTDEQ